VGHVVEVTIVARVIAAISVVACASVCSAQLVLYPSDTPLVIPNGGAGNATSWVSTTFAGTVTGLQVYAEITFANPGSSGALLNLVGPNTVPPSGFCYLGCVSGGDAYMIMDDAAPQSCEALGCCVSGCGAPGNPVYCSPFDSLTDFFGNEPSDGAPWGFQAGDGPPTGGTVIQNWNLTLMIEGGLFFDGFESGDTSAWSG
jgi:hypothetical protein